MPLHRAPLLPLAASAGLAFARLILIVPSFVLVLFALLGCEKDVALVDPPPLFTFDADNAWPATCIGAAGSPADAGVPALPAVPPPPGLYISACPNPAPTGAAEIVIEFRLDRSVPGVNIAIVNPRGEIVRALMRDQQVEVDRVTRVSWLLDGVLPGDYRAYFRAGNLETFGDLKVQ